MRITIDTDTITAEEARAMCESIVNAAAASDALRRTAALQGRTASSVGPRSASRASTPQTRARVLESLSGAENGRSSGELMRATLASRQMLSLALLRLEANGVVRRSGTRRGTRWHLLPPAEPGVRDGVTGGEPTTTEREETDR